MGRSEYLGGFIAAVALVCGHPSKALAETPDAAPDGPTRISQTQNVPKQFSVNGVSERFNVDVLETEGCKFFSIKGCQGNQTTLRLMTPGGLFAQCEDAQENARTEVIRKNYASAMGQARVEGDWQAHDREKICGIGKYWQRDVSSLGSYVVWGGNLSIGQVKIAAAAHTQDSGEIYANSSVPANLLMAVEGLGGGASTAANATMSAFAIAGAGLPAMITVPQTVQAAINRSYSGNVSSIFGEATFGAALTKPFHEISNLAGIVAGCAHADSQVYARLYSGIALGTKSLAGNAAGPDVCSRETPFSPRDGVALSVGVAVTDTRYNFVDMEAQKYANIYAPEANALYQAYAGQAGLSAHSLNLTGPGLLNLAGLASTEGPSATVNIGLAGHLPFSKNLTVAADEVVPVYHEKWLGSRFDLSLRYAF